jgi:beta-mannosidase
MIHPIYGKQCMPLDGMWRYKLDQNDIGKRQSYYLLTKEIETWREMKIPGNWYLEEEIGDFFGTIWFARKFEVPENMRGQRLFLNFEGVDYIAEVWLNGEYLGLHEGMFDPFEFEITSIVQYDAENIITLRDSAPKDPAEYVLADYAETPLSEEYKDHQSRYITQIKGHMIEAMHRPGCLTKFRQDGNSGGVWGSVSLVAKPETHIDYVKVFTSIVLRKDWAGDCLDHPDGSGLAAFDVFISSASGVPVKTDLEVGISAYNFESQRVDHISRPVVLQPGDNVFKIAITIPDVKLWWTWDHGFPHLYTATLKAAGDAVKVNFGVKEVYADQDGQWYLNNQKIFLRGMRYISSLWMSEAGPRLWKDDFQKMLDMDINSIRIGSHVERDGLYTLCDEMGLLLWQVFPIHYCISESEDVIDRASDMIRNMGYMLTNHACMGMWSVYKEPEVFLLKDKPNVYFKLCDVLRETLGTIDPMRWIHKGDYREGVLNIMTGSCWDGETDWNKVEIQPNIVEFGCDSVPCLDTLRKLIPEDKLWPPDWDTWEYWGLFYRNQFKHARVQMGSSLEEFIDNTQTAEALFVKEQIEALRQRKYRPVSSMYLYYWSDACPIMGSGLFDYYRKPYQVYESMKQVYSQVLVSLAWNRSPYMPGKEKRYRCSKSCREEFVGKVWVNNDRFQEIENVKIHWDIVKAGSEDILLQKDFVTTLKADSAEVLDTIRWYIPIGQYGEYDIRMRANDQDGRALSANSTRIRGCR